MDEGGIGLDSSDDIQTQVFKTTLAEIETSRENPEEPSESHDCCVICLDAISDPCAALPCGHAHFDFICLKAEAFYRVPNTPRNRHEQHDTLLDTAGQRRFTSHNDLLRETERRRRRPPPTVDEAILRRRNIYHHQLYSLRKNTTSPSYGEPNTNQPLFSDIGSNRISRYRPPPTPVQFSSTPHLVSRARLWIRRELQAFSFLSDPDPDDTPNTATPTTTTSQSHHQQSHHPTYRPNHNAEFLLEYIIAILKTVDLQDSAGQAEAMLADFLGGASTARLFLHELRSWLRSPAPGLAAWDREVQYPAARREAEGGGGEGQQGEGLESYSRRRRSRGSVGGCDRGQGDEDDWGGVYEDGRGRSWRDRGGDHWRAGTYVGEWGNRKEKGR
ncbi:hypothetical protein CHGG_09625 [Chaetomium globosum CBS 148.51]|uniref:RING-type E3 ubiquitin transferase n=1 Tax=Chaetomium globosum (strain ATCC 6205 / CBS 148.51 / DSM 1962 / NBRC 6347 / NRRL 1970) TaxID=306901 RepID=Q2GQX9_CHAGB|nr:uncharacterized protein CHGG_09625 [Chaetomium globosum CBS 148.51]EAQ83221.1 hypothetical protein CHGG_09625 [Chaetomium globosum CBS 148.51]